MAPTLVPGTIVLGVGWYRSLREGDIVIVMHDNLEKIKRVAKVAGDSLYVLGDNLSESTDSRNFGRVSKTLVLAKVWQPRSSKRHLS